MNQKLYIVDAFAKGLFSGNPAAVCPLNEWLADDILQKIAMENNQAETAFYVKESGGYSLRWFTPLVEVDLCGHATLATAHVMYTHEGYEGQKIVFNSRSGPLTVQRIGDGYSLDFPADVLAEVPLTKEISDCFDLKPKIVFKGKTDYMLVYENESDIRKIQPNFDAIAKLPARGVIITSHGGTVDFVSRFFAPQCGINEDPATGSAHTSLAVYWSRTLAKKDFEAIQLSKRKGYVKCIFLGDRVELRGAAKTYLIGQIWL
jgi:PhzF family phenazine biosynthesis protein